jgi:quercetin dioxygenase-like cupin family protein
MTSKIAIFATLTAIAFAASAHAGPIEREELFRAELASCAGTEVIVARLQIEPGAVVPRHSHNGDEHLAVIQGGPMAMPDGKTIDLPTGAALDFARGVEHGGLTATGDAPMVLYTVHIVDKDAPLNVAAR